MLQDSSSNPTSSQPVTRSNPDQGKEPIRHLLVGSSSGVQRTIYQLHTLGYAEVARWTHPITIPDRQIIITPDQGEVMSLLVKLIRPN